MNSTDYAVSVLSTESRPKSLNIDPAVLVDTLGIAMTVGDIVDTVKKAAFYQQDLDRGTMIRNLLVVISASKGLIEGLIAGKLDDDFLAASNIDPARINTRLLHCALGKYGESAELITALFNTMTGAPLDELNFLEELGDADWYGPIAMDELGVSEACVRTMNVAKLTLVRYAAKKFTGEDARDRKKALERTVMQFVLNCYRQSAVEPDADFVLERAATLFGLEYKGTSPVSDPKDVPNAKIIPLDGVHAGKVFVVGRMSGGPSPDVPPMVARGGKAPDGPYIVGEARSYNPKSDTPGAAYNAAVNRDQEPDFRA